MLEIGKVKRLQVQLDALKKGEEPNRYYDTDALRSVPAARLTVDGVIGLEEEYELMDVHNANHQRSRNQTGNAITFNFTFHYERMRSRYGSDLSVGCAGENILIETEYQLDISEFIDGLIIEGNNEREGRLTRVRVAVPCVPFSEFVLDMDGKPPAELTKETLQFLDGGTRGYRCEWISEPLVVRQGDRVFIDG
jgi:hypothetical protein